MAKTFKCPHCGALYDYYRRENRLRGWADCRVCGKQMDVTKGSSILRYELVKMPDGTNV